jgi:hypothetical protein
MPELPALSSEVGSRWRLLQAPRGDVRAALNPRYKRPSNIAGTAGTVKVTQVEPAAAPKRTTLAVEYRQKILAALVAGELDCPALASACGCAPGRRSFERARQLLTAEGKILATGKSKARVFRLPLAQQQAA